MLAVTIFSRKHKQDDKDLLALEEARTARWRARQQLERADKRQKEIDEEIRHQRRVREENGFGEIISAIFIDHEEKGK